MQIMEEPVVSQFQSHVPGLRQPQPRVMRTQQHILNRAFSRSALWLMTLIMLLTFCCEVRAQGFAGGQKAGSVLFYHIYTSSSYNTAASDTLISISNTSAVADIRIHFFFVDGFSCQVADSFIYLTKSQTARFMTSDVDPDVRGYLIALAVNEDGVPVQHNELIGSLKVKQALGPTSAATHSFDLPAVAFAKINDQAPAQAPDSVTAELLFDGGATGSSYEQLPGEVSIDNFESPSTADTRLIIYSPKTSLYGAGDSGGRIFVLYFDELENPFSASIGMNCWLQGRLTMVRNLSLRIPAGQTGWAKLTGYRNDARIPLLGAVVRAAELSGGHNLHHLNPFPSFRIIVPVFPPGI